MSYTDVIAIVIYFYVFSVISHNSDVIPLVEFFLVMSYMFLLFGVSGNFDRMLDIIMITC